MGEINEIISLDIALILYLSLYAIEFFAYVSDDFALLLLFLPVSVGSGLIFWFCNISDAWDNRKTNREERTWFILMIFPFLSAIMTIAYYVQVNRNRMIKEKKCRIFWKR